MLNPARARRPRRKRTGGRTGKNEDVKEGYRFEGGTRCDGRARPITRQLSAVLRRFFNTGLIRVCVNFRFTEIVTGQHLAIGDFAGLLRPALSLRCAPVSERSTTARWGKTECGFSDLAS